MTATTQRLFSRCGCGTRLLTKRPQHATHVLNGIPVCPACFVDQTIGLDSDEGGRIRPQFLAVSVGVQPSFDS